MTSSRKQRIESFEFEPGYKLGWKYEIIDLLGQGWEGEVYLVREQGTNIERAAKFFFPHRNPGNRNLMFYARKLHRLRRCPILIQYVTREETFVHGQTVSYLVSDFVEGEMLSEHLKHQPGGRLQPFQALHLLHDLAAGMELVHQAGEYHGDLHDDNIIVRQVGLNYEIRVLDLYSWGRKAAQHIRDDVCDMVRVLYDCTGGKRFYARQPSAIKDVCCGLKRGMILSKFKSAGRLRQYLETLDWEL